MDVKKKFLSEVGKFNDIVQATRDTLMEDFCRGEAISPFQYSAIKNKLGIDLMKEMNDIVNETVKLNFQIMAKNKDNRGTAKDFTSSLMTVFTKRTDKFFEEKADLVTVCRMAEIFYNIKLDDTSTDRAEVDRCIDKMAEAKVLICEQFLVALAKRIGNLKMTV